MVEVLALGFGVVVGLDWRRLATLAVILAAPVVAAAGLFMLLLRARQHVDGSAAVFCETVAAELRSGSSLRHALASSSAAVDARATDERLIELPPAELASALCDRFPGIGPELKATIVAVERSGPRAADLFEEIAALSIAHTEMVREVRIASAPAKATALLFVGAPAVYMVWQIQSGSLVQLLTSPSQRLFALTGFILFLAGLAGGALLLWRTR